MIPEKRVEILPERGKYGDDWPRSGAVTGGFAI